MATFLLVHGAWHGGWCWQRVAAWLNKAGHRVLTPTLTGLGEKSHLLRPDIDLTLHIQDIVNALRWEDLREVVLCGHSYGGMVITGVAEQESDRLASLVYLDAFVPVDGEAVTDLLLSERLADMQIDLAQTGDGWKLSPVSAERFGVGDPEDRAWVDGKCTPHPWATFTQPISLSRGHHAVSRRSYILAAEYDPSPFQRYGQMARKDASWKFHALPTGHDAMVTMPEALAKLLEEAAA